MFDFVFSLRFLLLVIGALFVVGIYLWGSGKNRRSANIAYDPRQVKFKPAKRRSGSHGATSFTRDGQRSIERDNDIDIGSMDDLVLEDEALMIEELPAITRKDDDADLPLQSSKEGQLELTFDADTVSEIRSASDRSAPAPQESIIALYIRPPAGHEFAGSAIVRSMNSVGLHFGDMNIFHHFGAGDLRTELPLFSVANMLEPGHFDLQDIDSFSTPGLALILRLPGSLDGAVAFELFLNTAQRLAEALSGDLYGDPKKLLDSTAIDKMRRIAAPFTNGG